MYGEIPLLVRLSFFRCFALVLFSAARFVKCLREGCETLVAVRLRSSGCPNDPGDVGDFNESGAARQSRSTPVKKLGGKVWNGTRCRGGNGSFFFSFKTRGAAATGAQVRGPPRL